MGSNDSIIEEIIRSYPTLSEKMCSLKYSISSSHGKDPTASAASVELPAEEQRRYKAIVSAIGHTMEAYQDGSMRMLFIRAFYWDNTPVDAVILKKVSCFNAREYRYDFIQAVSQRLQLCSCSDCIYWRKLFTGKSGSDVNACLYCNDTGRLRVHDGKRCYSKQLENKVSQATDANSAPAQKPEVSA
ncbi:hypothetical protein [Oscillibacter sp.]|uniref:hypothetical protein n=1 Tax=Oscillibacter sp. TaxID=1945593 RepID=UPI0028A610FF|nr:hypothetical protein [Oscillibacter sp.]